MISIKKLYSILFIFALLSSQSNAQNAGLATRVIAIHQTNFIVEIADTFQSRATGLMFRRSMPENHGMLFVFEDENFRSFYMRNTFIPLSIAYINSDGIIMEIHDMEPLSLRSVPSRFPAQYALELNQGAFERAGIRVGMRIQNIS